MRRTSVVAMIAVLGISASQVCAQEIQRVPTYRTVVKVLRETDIAMEVAGTLKTVVPQVEGEFFKKGDLLAVVNDEVIKAEVDTADFEAEMLKVEIEFSRIARDTEELNLSAKIDANKESPNAYSPAEIRQNQLELEKAKASLLKSQKEQEAKVLAAKVKHEELKRYSVFAPHDGVITDIKMFPGQSPRQGDPVLTLTDLSVLEAEVLVPVMYRDSLHIGDEVEFRPISGMRAAAAPAEIQKVSAQESNDEGSLFRPAQSSDESPFDTPAERTAQAAASSKNASSDEVFIGKIRFIKPRLTVEQNQSYIMLSVHVTNPQDSEGRYRLQEGMVLDAVVLSSPRAKTTSLKK